MKMHLPCILLLALASPAAFAAPPMFTVSAVQGQVGALSGNQPPGVVQPGHRIGAQTQVRTADNSRVDLQLGTTGTVGLGANSQATVHSIEADESIARLIIDSGSTRVRSRGGSDPVDLRVNIGALRLRVVDAEIWGTHTAQHDEVCLLSGAIDLQTPDSTQRMTTVGDCLRLSGTRVETRHGAATEPFAPQVFAFLGSSPARPDHPATALQTPAASAPIIATAQTPAVAVPATSASSDNGNWAIVLGSFEERSKADLRSQQLRGSGIDSRVAAATTASGSTLWRVVSGHYPSKQAAADDLDAMRHARGISGAWLWTTP